MGLALPGMVPAADLPAAAQIVQEIERGRHPGIESFIMQVEGQVVASHVTARLQHRLPDLRSITKSITALLLGIALERGEIAALDTKVAELLPARRALLLEDARKGAITLEHLLTMRSGLACNDWDPASPGHEDKMYQARDWVAFWARQPMQADPGSTFSYCTGNVIVLGEILAAATGMQADAYAQRHLFEPLGIKRAEWQRWNRGRGIDTGGHLRLAPADLLKIGQLVLERGVADGRQIVAAEWLAAMTRPHATLANVPQQYGYLWWIDQTRDPALPATSIWSAQGNGGNFLLILPALNTVLVVTATRFNRQDAFEPLAWLRDRLLPAMAERQPPPG